MAKGAVGGIATNTFDVLLRFVVDKQALAEARAAGNDTADVVRRMGDAGGLVTLAAMRLQPALDAQIAKNTELQKSWFQTQRVLRASTFAFQEITKVGLGMVLPIIGAATLFAAEAKKTEGILDPVAEKWLAYTAQIKASTLQIGKSSASVLMPYLAKAAELADKGAKIVEQHPEILEAALKIGAAVATVGVLGKLVTDGVKMVVDIKFVYASIQNELAGKAMIDASVRNLEAAFIMLDAGNTMAAQDLVVGRTTGMHAAPLTGSGGASLVQVAVVGIAAVVGAQIGSWVGNAINKKIQGENFQEQSVGGALKQYPQMLFRMFSLPGQALILKLNEMGVASDKLAGGIGAAIHKTDTWLSKILGLNDGMDKSAEAAERLVISLKGHEKEADIVAAYAKMIEGNAEAAKALVADQEKVVKDSNAKLLAAWSKYRNDVASIANKLVDDIIKVQNDASKAQAEDDAAYAADRNEIVRDGGEEILRIEKDNQEKLRKLLEDHLYRRDQLIGERDALGLVEEDRRYQMERDQLNREANEEIAQRRQDIAQRLVDLDAGYKAERAQRVAETAAKIKELQDQAKADTIKRQQEYLIEAQTIRNERAQKLRELQEQFAAERAKRLRAFHDFVYDLDASLLGEQQLKQRYYNQMLNDADLWLSRYRAKLQDPLGGGTSWGQAGAGINKAYYTPKASGNYVSGNIHTGEEGEEFLLTRRSTKMAEDVIGGRLTQESLMSRIAGGNQYVSIQMDNGMTVLQVKRMLERSQQKAFMDLAEVISGGS